MSYTAVITVNTGDPWTAGNQNTYLRDNMASTAVGIVTTAGDIVYASGANALSRLAIGTAGQYLRVDSGAPAWGNPDYVMELRILPFDENLETGDELEYIFIPEELDGYIIESIHFGVDTASTSGTPEFQVYHERHTADILSTTATIDANEKTSYDASTPPVVNSSYDDLETGDRLRVDVDTAGTGTKGLTIFIKVTK